MGGQFQVKRRRWTQHNTWSKRSVWPHLLAGDYEVLIGARVVLNATKMKKKKLNFHENLFEGQIFHLCCSRLKHLVTTSMRVKLSHYLSVIFWPLNRY